jgi:hypothetical protein
VKAHEAVRLRSLTDVLADDHYALATNPKGRAFVIKQRLLDAWTENLARRWAAEERRAGGQTA